MEKLGLKKIGIANLLTIFRIVCIPFFIFFFATGEYFIALIIFSLAAFTDLIDGTVARLMKERSQFGALLDPFADKGLMFSTFVALAIKGVVPWWFIYVILVRDVVVVSGFFYVRFIKHIEFKYHAIFSSKMATLFEIITGAMALVYLAFPKVAIWVYPIGDMVYGSIMIAAVLILIAAMRYLKLGIDLIEGKAIRGS